MLSTRGSRLLRSEFFELPSDTVTFTLEFTDDSFVFNWVQRFPNNIIHVLDEARKDLRPAIITSMFRRNCGEICAIVKYFAKVTPAFRTPYISDTLFILAAKGIGKGEGIVSLQDVKGKFFAVHHDWTLSADPLETAPANGQQQTWTLTLLRHCLS